MHTPESIDLLKKVDNLLEEDTDNLSLNEKLEILRNASDITSGLHNYKPQKRSGVLGVLKFFIENKVHNIVIGSVERSLMRQQQFNEALVAILEEHLETDEK